MTSDSSQTPDFAELLPIRDLIAESCGLYFDEKKLFFIEKRITRRVKATNSESIRNYFRLLKLGQNSQEMKELISLLTTNETYFFRNPLQLASFVDEILPLICSQKRERNKYQLNLWSAGCSSGEEPYTLAILLREKIEDYARWHVTIHATDIDQHILGQAQKGLFDKRAFKEMPPAYLEKYFTSDNNKFQITPEISTSVSFNSLNLMDRKAIRSITDMDIVFCRNVLVYFDDKARTQVVNSLYDSLAPGGYIFLGESESIGKISATFKLVKLKNTLTYQK